MHAVFVPCDQKFSSKWNLSFFKPVPPNKAAFLAEQLAPYNQLLIQSLLLVPECYFPLYVEARVLKFKFWSLSPFFSECSFLWLQHFFLICLIWYDDDDHDDDDDDDDDIFSRDHCQRSSPSRISDTRRAGFEPAQNLSSGLVEWSCAAVTNTTHICVLNCLMSF